MPIPFETPWIRRTKWLTQALIISGTLNIGLSATFVYVVLKEKQDALVVPEAPHALTNSAETPTNTQLLQAYSRLPYQELLLRLENKDLIEEGLTKRDLALSCLVAFHYFNLEKALGDPLLQKRQILHAEGALTVFPGLTDDQFQAILQYAYTEKWPLTSEGLFYALKTPASPRDPSLLEAFSLSSEFHAVQSLFTKTGVNLSPGALVDLLSEGDWKQLTDFTAQQKQSPDFTPERRRTFLLSYPTRVAAQLLLQTDLEFALKRLSDTHILALLERLSEQTPELEAFARELLASPRTDAVWKQAALLLYSFAGETIPRPYNHAQTLARFFQKTPAPPPSTKRIHTVEPGENLWKIARKYHVRIDEIIRLNHLENEKLRPGKQLEIP